MSVLNVESYVAGTINVSAMKMYKHALLVVMDPMVCLGCW